jgi:hypothetical protein
MASPIRWLVACLLVLGLLSSVADFFNRQTSVIVGDLNNDFDTTSTIDVVKATKLDHLIVRGDLRRGDRLKLLEPLVFLRFETLAYPAKATFLDLRTGRSVEVADVPGKHTFTFAPWRLMQIAIEICAILLLVARGSRPGVMPLCIFLFLDQFLFAAYGGFLLGTPGYCTFEFLKPPLDFVMMAALISFATAIAAKTTPARVISIFGYVGAAAMGIALALQDVAVLAGVVTVDQRWIIDTTYLAVKAALLFIALAIFALGARASSGADRRRTVILGIATLIGSSIDLYSLFGGPSYYDAFEATIALAAITVMATGLVYGIVVEHLFDIAFVVNRAVVYGATSAFVVLSFVAIEWVVGWSASSLGHVDSAALQLALAIVVALSLRPIHGRVDRFVDNAIFAARHRSANALRRFADDCGEYRSEAALLAATLDTLHTYARVSACGVFLLDEEGDLHPRASDEAYAQTWSGDDVAVVRMRTSRKVIFRSELPQLRLADVAFPMLRRRTLIGAIACTLPARSEPYSPEECDALETVAREVGASLTALEAVAAQRLATENTELRARLAIEGLR